MIESTAQRRTVKHDNAEHDVLCVPSSLPEVFGDDYPPSDIASLVAYVGILPDTKAAVPPDEYRSAIFILARCLSPVDGSKTNLCVKGVPASWTRMVWKGPMAIVRGRLAAKYLDPKSLDAPFPIVEFEDVLSTDLDKALNFLRTSLGEGVLKSVTDPETALSYSGLRNTGYDSD